MKKLNKTGPSTDYTGKEHISGTKYPTIFKLLLLVLRITTLTIANDSADDSGFFLSIQLKILSNILRSHEICTAF